MVSVWRVGLTTLMFDDWRTIMGCEVDGGNVLDPHCGEPLHSFMKLLLTTSRVNGLSSQPSVLILLRTLKIRDPIS